MCPYVDEIQRISRIEIAFLFERMKEIFRDKTYDIFKVEEPVPNSERVRMQGCPLRQYNSIGSDAAKSIKIYSRVKKRELNTNLVEH